MKRVIHKQELEIVDEQEIEIYQYYKFLSAQIQNGTLCLWYSCDPDTEKTKVKIVIKGTGHIWSVDEGALYYIGTVQEMGYVWHVFEDKRWELK